MRVAEQRDNYCALLMDCNRELDAAIDAARKSVQLSGHPECPAVSCCECAERPACDSEDDAARKDAQP